MDDCGNCGSQFLTAATVLYGMISEQGVSRVSGEWCWFLSRPNQCLGTETEDKDQMHEPQCRNRKLSFDLMLKQIPWLMSRRGWVSWDLLIWGPLAYRSGQLHRCGGSTMVWQCPCNFRRQCRYDSAWFGCLVSSSTPFSATHNDRNGPRSFRWWQWLLQSLAKISFTMPHKMSYLLTHYPPHAYP